MKLLSLLLIHKYKSNTTLHQDHLDILDGDYDRDCNSMIHFCTRNIYHVFPRISSVTCLEFLEQVSDDIRDTRIENDLKLS